MFIKERKWDLENERRAMPYILKDMCGDNIHKLSMAQKIDFAITTGGGYGRKVIGLVEFKCWPNKNIEDCTEYFFININKYTVMQSITMVPTKLFVWGMKNGDLYYWNTVQSGCGSFIGLAPSNVTKGDDLVLEIPKDELIRFSNNPDGWVTEKDYFHVG